VNFEWEHHPDLFLVLPAFGIGFENDFDGALFIQVGWLCWTAFVSF